MNQPVDQPNGRQMQQIAFKGKLSEGKNPILEEHKFQKHHTTARKIDS